MAGRAGGDAWAHSVGVRLGLLRATPRRRLRVITGGQTGVDRGALDAARAAGLLSGGWCPRGRRAEDGRIPAKYPLQELPGGYANRTRANVVHSDATLVLHVGRLSGGTQLALNWARRLRRPVRVVDLSQPDADRMWRGVARWILSRAFHSLHVAGPRESEAPGAAAEARRWLRPLFRAMGGPSPFAGGSLGRRWA